MLTVSIAVALSLFGAALMINLYRLFTGPEVPDRILALDTMFINTIALVILLGILFDTRASFEIALLIALMGFIGTVSMAKFLLRGDVIE